MKKFAIATSALTLIVVIGLLVKRNQLPPNDIGQHSESKETMQEDAKIALEEAQTALGKVPTTTPKATVEIEPVTEEEEGMVLTEDQMIKLEAYFEKVEKDWSDKMNQLFVRELGLEAKVLQEYWKMREGYEQDKLDAFEEFHEE